MFNLKKSMRKLNEGKLDLSEGLERPEIDASVFNPYDKKIRVFVFETLMSPAIRAAVLKSEIEVREGYLPNYKEISIESDEGSDYHTIIPSLGSMVKGLILMVNEEQLAKLDYWEDQYDRVKAVLGNSDMAYVYVLRIDHMKDRGQNTDVELNTDDFEQIVWAADNM